MLASRRLATHLSSCPDPVLPSRPPLSPARSAPSRIRRCSYSSFPLHPASCQALSPPTITVSHSLLFGIDPRPCVRCMCTYTSPRSRRGRPPRRSGPAPPAPNSPLGPAPVQASRPLTHPRGRATGSRRSALRPRRPRTGCPEAGDWVRSVGGGRSRPLAQRRRPLRSHCREPSRWRSGRRPSLCRPGRYRAPSRIPVARVSSPRR